MAKHRITCIDGVSVMESFGWDTPGVRGYVYGSTDLTIVVIAFEGRSFTRIDKPPDLLPTDMIYQR